MTDLTDLEARILRILDREPMLTPTGLWRRLAHPHKRAVLHATRALCERGFLTCTTCPEPGRLNPANRYRLTPGVTP